MPAKDPDVAERFARDVENHKIEIIRDDGLYRHIKLSQSGTSVMRFDLITWPGYLCYTGDMGTFVFSRLSDMFDFFRGQRPNLSYWGEKVLASYKSGGISQYSADAFNAQITEYFERRTYDWNEDKKKAVWHKVQEQVLSVADDGECAAREAAARFSVFVDFWEADCTEYSFCYQWCCHAIPWGIAQYDNLKELRPTQPTAAPPPSQ